MSSAVSVGKWAVTTRAAAGKVCIMKIRQARASGFTLIEIMIVIAIIGMLAAVAIPSLSKARSEAQKKACILNLRSIQSAKECWATDFRKATGTPVDMTQVDSYLKDSKEPQCPAGGTYTYHPVGQNPTCSLGESEGHKI